MKLISFLRRGQKASPEQLMRQAWDERARENARYYVATNDWETEEEFDRSGEGSVDFILSDIGHFCPPHTAVLEIGCGIGRMLKPLAKRFRKVYGVDISAEMVRQAKERVRSLKNVKVWVNNGRDLKPLRARKVDLVISFIVFQHIPDPAIIRSYIADALRVLKPGGLFKFQVWGREDTPEAATEEAEREKTSWFGARFTEPEIRRITADAGFEILSTYVIHTPEVEYLWVIALKP